MKKNPQKTNWNFPKIMFRIFFVVLLLLVGQFAYLSLSPSVYGYDMEAFATNRNTVRKVLPATRGTVYDNSKQALALNVSSYTVIAYLSANRTGSSPVPLHVVDPKMTASKLSPLLKMSVETLEELLTRDVYQVELGPGGRDITELEKNQIEELNLPGIDFVESHKRYYPNGDFASYVLGYAVSKENTYIDPDLGSVTETDINGELGVEVLYNELLKGKDGKLIYQQDRFGYRIPDTKEVRIEPQDGANIYLTIDSNIQRFVEAAVKDNSAIYKPEWLQLTVMEAKTGRIVGTASTPSFNPNIKNITNYENPLVSYLYEPGSVMKIYTYMCAIEKGTYNGSDTFLSGKIKIGDDTIYDWDRKGWGTITYDKGFEYSSNVGVTNMLQTILNKNDLKQCFTKYGFGQQTGIELPREFVGSIKFTYPIEVASAGYGQGITTTSIQQLQALTMLANNGRMVKPHIVDKIVDPNNDKILYESTIEKTEQLVKTSTINKLKDLMYDVIYGTDSGTTGRAYQIQGFDIIGKTGTSQIYDNEHGRYTDQYIYSFSGMFPKDEPEYIVYGAMRKPVSGGNRALANATKSTIEGIAKYKNMFSEVTEQNSASVITIPSFYNKTLIHAKKELAKAGITPVVIGNGAKVIQQYPAIGTKILSYEKVFLVTNDTLKRMPDITGWSRAEVLLLCDILGIDVTFQNFGYVKTQSIAKNTIITGKESLNVTLEEKINPDVLGVIDDKKGSTP